MNYEERNAAAATARARAEAIGAALKAETSNVWTVTRPHETGAHFQREIDGLAIYMSTNWSNKPNQIHFSTDVPRNADGAYPYLRDEQKIDGINVACSKSDAQIARDVVRRLVTPYEPVYSGLMADKADTLATYAKAIDNAQAVAKAIGGQVRIGYREETIKGAHEHEIVKIKAANVSNVKVNYNGRVTFDVSLPMDKAIAFIKAQPAKAE